MLQIQQSDLVQPGYGTKTGLPKPLIGGMRLDTHEMPVRAVGRPADPAAIVELSYPIARGCAKLLAGEITSVKLVGNTSDKDPTGLHIILGNGKSEAWVVEPYGSGASTALTLCGMPFSSQLVNYNLGIAIALYALFRRKIYPHYISATEKAIIAWQGDNELLRAQSLALMADELAFAVEQMLAGNDPLGIDQVVLHREKPVDLDKVFDGGDLLQQAFTSVDAFRQLAQSDGNSPVTAMTTDIADDGHSVFVGDLPMKLKDCILRGKHVLLTGPTATGKTLAIEEACITLGAPLTVIRGSEGLEDRDLIASVSITGGDTVTHFGPVPEAMLLGHKHYELQCNENAQAKRESREPVRIPPSVILIDEVNRLQTRHQNFLVSMLNVRRATADYYLRIPDTNEEITCPDGFLVVVAARNIGGAFFGTNSMDLALERRFYKKIDLKYLPPEQEASLVRSRTGLDDMLTKVLVKVASDTRFQLAQLKAPLDTDTLLKWAEEIVHIQGGGSSVTDQVLLEVARDVVFDVVLERTERGEFDPAGEAILMDNISENWRDMTQF